MPEYAWVTRRDSSVAHLLGLLRSLRDLDAALSAAVHVLTVTADCPLEVPAGFAVPSGRALPPRVFTVEDLPVQGVLLVHDVEVGAHADPA